MVLASVSSRCTPRSAAASGARAASICSRARGMRDFGARARRSRLRPAPPARRRAPSASAGRSGCAAAGRGQAGFDIGEFGLEPRGALLVIAQRRLQLVAARRQIGERAGQFGKGLFRCRERRVGAGDPLVDAGEPRRRWPALRP